MADIILYQEAGKAATVTYSLNPAVPATTVATDVTPAGLGYLIVPEASFPVYDPNVYEVNLTPDNINPTNYSIDPIALVTSKKYYVDEVAAAVPGFLASSDWLDLRALNGGDPIPAAWATYRTDIRNEAVTKAAAINGAADAAALEAYVQSAAYTTWPATPTDSQL